MVILFSCHTGESEGDRLLREFDSVNKSLEQSSAVIQSKGTGAFSSDQNFNQQIYDSLEVKFADKGGYDRIRQMYYHVYDFYGYTSDLKRRFYILCGDSTGADLPVAAYEDIAKTNEFFLHTEPATYLLSQLLQTKKSLLDNTQSDSIRQDIKAIGTIGERKSHSAEYWRNKYFKDVPPIAAITILNSFVAQIRKAEAYILSDYLKQ